MYLSDKDHVALYLHCVRADWVPKQLTTIFGIPSATNRGWSVSDLCRETDRASNTKLKAGLQTPAHKPGVRYKDPEYLLSTHLYPVSSRYAGCYAPVPSQASRLEI